MITTIEQIVAMSEEDAKNTPILAHELRILSPGVSEADIQRLQRILPGISPIYTDLLKAYDWNNKSFGGIDLTPCGAITESIIHKLIEANTIDPQYPEYYLEALPYLRKDKTYAVASYESDSIAIVYEDGPYKKEQVLWYDIHNLEAPPTLLADRFDQFLLILGNIHDLCVRIPEQFSPQEAKTEFWRRLDILMPNRTEATNQAWDLLILTFE